MKHRPSHVLAARVVRVTDCLVKDMSVQPCYSFRLAADVFLTVLLLTHILSVLQPRLVFFRFGLLALSVFGSWP